MDAKPQRPRVLRINDENAPFLSQGPAPGKTLHHRTKSTPAFSTLLQSGGIKATAAAAAVIAANKKVLGEVNTNIRPALPAKDDSEVGKASPGKISLHDAMKPVVTAPLARPASRPLAPKPSVLNIIPNAAKPTTTSQQHGTGSEPLKSIVAKKSTKVLRDAEAVENIAAGVVSTVSTQLPSMPTINTAQPTHDKSVPTVDPVQLKEIRKTETVPLRDEPVARPLAKSIGSAVPHFPPGFLPQHEHPVTTDNAHIVAPYGVNGQLQLPVAVHTPQYYDAEETQYDYDDGYTTGRSFAADNTATIVGVPVYTDKVIRELREAQAYVDATRSPEEAEEEAWDMSMVAEYGDEIFEYMREKEAIMTPNPAYMDQQTEIQWSMRAVLMDWVVQVHQRFNLLPETLFLTVNYIDRFLSCKVVSLGKLQLVGATAIFIAAKYEEVQCPTISEIIYMVDGGYSAEELLKAERFMLSMLQFELGWPGPMSFLRRISKADDYDLETRTLAKYFLEVTVMDERFVGCPPSFLAAGAHCMARLMIYGAGWSQPHVHYSNYTFPQLKPLLKAIWEACEQPREHHSAVYDKYTDKRYKRASTFVEGKMVGGFRLPFDTPSAATAPGVGYFDGMHRLLR